MTGIVALYGGTGGSPFDRGPAGDDLDRSLFAEVGAHEVVVMPTAHAFEGADVLVDAANGWGARLGIEVRPLMVLTRNGARDDGAAAVIRGARAVVLVGSNAMHLRSALQDTPVWSAISGVPDAGGAVVAEGACASAVCDPLADPRGGGYTFGLGLVRGLAVATGIEEWSDDHRDRARALADGPLAEIPFDGALVRRGGAWSVVGDVVVHGELPSP